MRSLLVALLLFAVAPALAQRPAPAAPAVAHAPALAPPVAPRVPHPLSIHGQTLEDDYFWLREKGTPRVDAYLKAERDYAMAAMQGQAPLVETLYQEMVSRMAEDDTTAPYRMGSYRYFRRMEKGKQYQSLCRTPLAGGAEQVLLDLNVLGAKEKFISLGAVEVSDDQQKLAYSTDVTGFRDYTLAVKDLASGQTAAERIPHVNTVTWAADGKTLFYTVEDKAKRSYRVYRHVLGAPVDKDALVYEEKDERFEVKVDRTRDKKFLLMLVESHTTSETRVLPADRPTGEWRLLLPRQQDREYSVEHRNGEFWLRINDTGRNFRVVRAPENDLAPARWVEVVPQRDDVMIAGFELFARHLVLRERAQGLPRLRVVELATGKDHLVAFPEVDYMVSSGPNMEFDTDVLRYEYQSPISPPSAFDYDLRTRQATLVKRAPAPHYDASRYKVERVFATASDGTRIPITVVLPVGFQKDGKAPFLLYGYGSYGISIDARFDRNVFSMLDRGVGFAVAHIRGGGELGKRWHDAGRMRNKRNTFTDFIAAAEYLVKERYTSPARLAAQGGSAGGLLMGAVVNLRPDLFRVILAQVPFVDVVNTMLDESLPLTVGEFEEWGNPKKPDEFAYIRGYSPYDNVAARAYPSMLVVSSINDSQVMYWEPAKWVAKLRAKKTDKNPLLFRINLDPSGHGGKAGRYERLRDVAWDDAFLLRELGVTAR